MRTLKQARVSGGMGKVAEACDETGRVLGADGAGPEKLW